jgi:hypothetical protein
MGDHMFTDLALSADQMDEFNKKYTTASKLSVMVLQRSVWPFGVRNKAIDLPPSVSPPTRKPGTYLFICDRCKLTFQCTPSFTRKSIKDINFTGTTSWGLRHSKPGSTEAKRTCLSVYTRPWSSSCLTIRTRYLSRRFMNKLGCRSLKMSRKMINGHKTMLNLGVHCKVWHVARRRS